MTYAEMTAFVRQQIDEDTEAFWSVGDIDRYLHNAIARFANKTRCNLVKKTFTVDEDVVGASAISEIFDITCIPDMTTQGGLSETVSSVADEGDGTCTFTTSGAHGMLAGEYVINSTFSETQYNGTFLITAVPAADEYTITITYSATDTGACAGAGLTIGGKYFKIYDINDTEYIVWYDLDNGNTAPAGTNLIEVNITTALAGGEDVSAATVASATATAIGAISGFSAVSDSDNVIVTVDAGYISSTHANVTVSNGGESLSISTTTAGLDGYYDIGYKNIKESAMVYINSDNDTQAMTPVSYEDWWRLTDEDRSNAYLYKIDPKLNALYVSTLLTGGTIYAEFMVHGESSNAEAFIADETIPAQYHETICFYAISMAFRKDKNVTMARDYMSHYIHDENEAMLEISARRTRSASDDWNTENTNQHRDESNLLQGLSET